MMGGFSGYGFAETVFLRCRFINQTYTAILTANPNAVDVWVEDCYFNGNVYASFNGATSRNGQTGGNFHAVNSVV